MKVPKIMVTSLNKNLYKWYAHKLIESYISTKQTVPLYIYTEDGFSLPTEDKNIYWFKLESEDLFNFIERNKSRRVENYLQDGIRFSFKVFAQYLSKDIADKMYFIDADCIFLNKVSEDWFDTVLPNEVYTSFYDRPGYYSETGFIGFNCSKQINNKFFEKYISYYTLDSLYTLPAFIDSCAYDYSREFCKNTLDYSEKTLGQYTEHGSIHVMKLDPNVNTLIDHKKGNRKNE